jgi:tRNA (guanine-N7-)-methyltransferase
MTRGQTRALNQYWHEFGIELDSTLLLFNNIFQRQAPTILEIGTGMGEVILNQAITHPENNYIAVEVHPPGIGSLIRQTKKHALNNLKIINNDFVDVLDHLVNNSITQINIFFPDPWPKKKHHKRRLVQADIISKLTTKLCNNGSLFLATDWEDLAMHMLDVCNAEPNLVNLSYENRFSPRPTWRVVSKFENRGYNLQHKFWELAYSKC